jgi:hypothetical protein
MDRAGEPVKQLGLIPARRPYHLPPDNQQKHEDEEDDNYRRFHDRILLGEGSWRRLASGALTLLKPMLAAPSASGAVLVIEAPYFGNS